MLCAFEPAVMNPFERAKTSSQIMVINSDDLSAYLRERGCRVHAIGALPAIGFKSLDAVLMDLGSQVANETASRFRSKQVESVLIHPIQAESNEAFLSISRDRRGRLDLHLLLEVLDHAISTTRLRRRLGSLSQALQCEVPTEGNVYRPGSVTA